MPGLFDPAPQEHADAYTALLQEQHRTHVWTPPVPGEEGVGVPAGHVRVQLYLHKYKVSEGMRPDVEAFIPLSKEGALDMWAVRKAWGLESCVVIDPERTRLYFLADPNVLDTPSVQYLVGRFGAVKLLEGDISTSTLLTRHLRQLLIALHLIGSSYYTLASSGAKHDARLVCARVGIFKDDMAHVGREGYAFGEAVRSDYVLPVVKKMKVLGAPVWIVVKQRTGPVWEYALPKAKSLVAAAKNGVAGHSITKTFLTFMLAVACLVLTTVGVASYCGHAWARGYFRDPPPGREQMGRGVILLVAVVVMLALGAGRSYLRGKEER